MKNERYIAKREQWRAMIRQRDDRSEIVNYDDPSFPSYSFEGHMFWGFSDFDAYLSCAYGNYMQLPPIEKRVIHHDYIAYWKH